MRMVNISLGIVLWFLPLLYCIRREETMNMKMKAFRPSRLWFIITLLIVFSNGCAQTKQYTPEAIGRKYFLSGMPAEVVRITVNDLRAERENSEELVQTIKEQVQDALSPEEVSHSVNLYYLYIDIIEHRSFFTMANWNASTILRIILADSKNNTVGNWNAEGNAQRSNMWGYITAKAVSQDAYNIAIADMMSILSSISLNSR